MEDAEVGEVGVVEEGVSTQQVVRGMTHKPYLYE